MRLQRADPLPAPPLFPLLLHPPTSEYKYEMPVLDIAPTNSLDILQQTTFPEFSPSELDSVLARFDNYVPPLPEVPQATPPPLQLAYVPPPFALFYTMPPNYSETPLLHKVWILDCKSCGKFLTNRGMKAVLLLRPHVPLYSTDAMPVNCSAYSPSAPAPRHSSRSSSNSTRSRTSSLSTRPGEGAQRTCECLTQTLACHGCGAQVGYMIVSPCAKCSSSTFTPPMPYPRSAHPNGSMSFMPPMRNRATNGHRFVFHSTEVVSEERLYISGEPGVIPDADPYEGREQEQWIPVAPGQQPPVPGGVFSPSHPAIPPVSPRSMTMSNAPGPQHFYHVFPLDRRVSGDLAGSNMSGHPHSSMRRSGNNRDMASPSPSFTPSPQIPPIHQYPGYPMQATPPPSPPKAPKIRGGDVLFWHHLVRHGELPGMYDDERARPSSGGGRSSSYDSDDDDKSRLPGVGGAVVCGR